jgi:formylglycine-generating enzyme required for sulfatase activity
MVSWYDVVKWCNAKTEWENALNGTALVPAYTVAGGVYRKGGQIATWTPSASGYRLPSEAEWEFAARGGNQTSGYTYSGSNDLNTVAWYNDNSGGAACDLLNGRGTWPAGQKAANELGLYDMSGNVWEWCWDEAVLSWDSFRYFRGGGYGNDPSYCTVSFRNNYSPDFRSNSIGFRLARTAMP